MKKTVFLSTCLLLLFFSCNTSSVYKSDVNFTDNQWHKNNPVSFDFTIEDESKLYDVNCILSHVYDYQFSSVPIEIKITKPNGSVETIPVDYLFKDKNGNDLGDCAGDICDLEQTILSKTKLTKGKYSISLSHSFEYNYLPNIIRVGIDVSESK